MGTDLRKAAAALSSGSAGRVRTAGRIEFVRDQGPVRRDIRAQDFEWRPETLRNLTKILWAVERSHGYAISALRLFSKMPSSEFSPDGLLGGRGYIQQVREMRSGLSQAVETLSSFTDTIHDEINAPHWAAGDDPVANEMMEGAQEVKSDPEGFVEDQLKKEVPEASEGFVEFSNPSPDDYNPFLNGDDQDDDGADGADWWDQYGDDGEPRTSAARKADSSVDPGTLPGPRVMHVGPGASPEEFGYFTDDGEVPSDDPLGEGFSQLDRIVESPVADGTTGYGSPTDGDESVFKTSADAVLRSGATYSWLPGADNQKLMNYYERGLTDSDVEWMRTHSDPDPPPGSGRPKSRPSKDPLWESLTSR